MNLKAIIQKIASWFKSDAQVIEQSVVERAQAEFGALKTVVRDGKTYIQGIRVGIEGPLDTWFIAKDGSFSITDPSIEATMSTPAAANATTPATTGNNVNTAVQIALALKAIDASLSVEAVQAATSAALTAAYPVAIAA
ncbi:hypothetical protein J2794_003587 [Paraburkholderia terricola]|uniref:hypothetical protein n=1 Tax=Paraburkholderia terricola TaxID=169427 RepID=UPI002864EF96|nr:hypothetical protein [Paraburkholderia terricola]MDR6447471.1 hypothetical protein [Paraburkholderia terricola]